jgi:hypothetical protein
MAKPQAQDSKQKGYFTKAEFDLLLKLAVHGELEAARCAKVRAYYGACILAAASIEAMLATCDLLPDEVRGASAKLKLKLRGSIDQLGLAALLKIATTAGWLPAEQQDSSKPDIQAVTDIVRRLRNLSHPGKHLHELKRVPLPRKSYRIARYTVDAVRDHLANKLGIELPPIS